MVGSGQPGQDPRQRRLAGAVEAVDQHTVTLVHDQVDIAQSGFAPRAFRRRSVADAGELQHRHRRAGLAAGGGHRSAAAPSPLPRGQVDHPVGGLGFLVVVRDVHQRHSALRVSPASTDISPSRPCWSTMLVTSSAISSAGLRASAAATASRCSSPPDRLPVSRSASPSSPTSDEQLGHVDVGAGGQPPHHVVGDPGAQYLALGVLHDHRGAARGAEPDPAGTLTVPSVGSRPARISISVVLPDPLAPVTARCSPGCTSIDSGPSASRVVPG